MVGVHVNYSDIKGYSVHYLGHLSSSRPTSRRDDVEGELSVSPCVFAYIQLHMQVRLFVLHSTEQKRDSEFVFPSVFVSHRSCICLPDLSP